MKKITSFLMMVVLCCVGAFAQESVGTELPTNKLITIGTAQGEMVPGKWYFLHNPRNVNQNATDFAEVGGTITTAGGFVTDLGAGNGVKLTASSVIDEVTNPEGVNANNYMANLVRFVAVEGEEGAYNIQFGTGNWVGHHDGGNSTNIGTVNNNNYMAGNAGKYNFYLVTIGGTPNAAGRFAWNKYNMANRVDNNGAGGTVVFWANGVTTGESEGWTTDADIKGNKIWQLYDILVVGELDVYAEAFNALIEDYTTITGFQEGAFIYNLLDGKNVGEKPGNYRPEDVNAFLEFNTKIEELIYTFDMEGLDTIQVLYPTVEDVEKLNEDYVGTYNHMVENRVPLAMTGIKPGYYTFNSCLYWYVNKNDTTFYTQEEADAANYDSGLVEGDEGWINAGDVKEIIPSQVPAPIRALCAESTTGSDGSKGEWLAHIPLKPEAKFLWKIETVEGKPTEYRMINMLKGETFTSISKSQSNGQLSKNDTATVCFDWRNDAEPVKYEDLEGNVVTDTVVSFNIRSSSQPSDGYNYLHCSGHSAGAGGQNWIVGWADEGATRWYMSPIDEATANQWIADAEKPKKLTAMMTKADSIIAAFPAQLEVAKDIVTTIFDNDSVVVSADQFSGNQTIIDGNNGLSEAPASAEDTYALLLDGNQKTYWHSQWNGSPFQKNIHYLQITATEPLEGAYAVKLGRRSTALGNQITKLAVRAYSEDNADLGFEDGEDLGIISLPFESVTETVLSTTFNVNGLSVIRFYFEESDATPGEQKNRGFWHAGEFNVFKAETTKRYPTTQYDVRKEQADALSAAIAAWEEKGFAEDSLELLDDETFTAAYNALVAAYEAWSKVYVDPAALREAIAAAPAENLFVIGNNPGQWKEGVTTPAATVAAAEAYNASGAYTPAESEAHLAAIAKAEADVWAAANKIETGKWYRFSFATEEMYDNYGWDKTGSKASENAAGITISPALWGKTIAVGKTLTTYEDFYNEEGEADTVATYSVEATEEWYEGDNLCFFEDADFSEGEDLFQFIQATDSSYMIQNKATGLFVRAGHPMTLSAVPSYFKANQAIGAGANLIAYTDVLGKTDGAHVYMHAERSTNKLTKWEANTVGSNSMIFIEEAEAVTEAPATNYTAKLWPGKVYTYTYPVDVTVADGATAYGAELVVAEEDTAIVLKTIQDNDINAGTPFILIANLGEGEEYITTSDRLKEIASEILADKGQYGLNEKQDANTRLNDEYALVSMDHGMKVDTVVTELLSLRGTLKSVTVEAGKGIVAKENGFEHTLINKSVSAYGAWIASDFDPESADVLSGLVIKIEGSIDTGISEVLDKVAKSGNIYNVAGQLVGKGNINTVNNLPAGVYIVNGVKVTKK